MVQSDADREDPAGEGYTAAQIRAAEAPLLAVGEPLMARAAHGLAARIRTLLPEQPSTGAARADGVMLLVGSGDNGGDALFAGAELAADGVPVEVVGLGTRMHMAGWSAAARAGAVRTVAPGDEESFTAWRDGLAERLGRVAVIVDGMLGIGTTAGAPTLRGRPREAVEAL
ncbi:MAG: NAD(P)H-hydrate epimerase, partial [Herbiconiux sp.]|nr:NAD(P)H-hydrate epimerase [Herbiconiux sp.]